MEHYLQVTCLDEYFEMNGLLKNWIGSPFHLFGIALALCELLTGLDRPNFYDVGPL